MPRINFAEVADLEPSEPIPPGMYHSLLADIDVVHPQGKQPFWKLRWIIRQGPFEGRTIADVLFFTPRALPRLKLLYRVAGFDTDGELDPQPKDLLRIEAMLTVEAREYEDKTGTARRGNSVAYNGYAALPEDGESEVGTDDDLGF